MILKEESRIDEARRFFERALQVRPAIPGARYQMATVYLSTGENTRALEVLEALVAESPAFIEARVSLATVYYRLKRKADGDREREKVAELTRAAQAKQPGPAAAAPSTVSTAAGQTMTTHRVSRATSRLFVLAIVTTLPVCGASFAAQQPPAAPATAAPPAQAAPAGQQQGSAKPVVRDHQLGCSARHDRP